MTTELEKQFFDTFGIEPYIRHWQQYNFAQVENGLKLFPERQKLADEGYIKITCKKLNPTEFNDCVYWEEYHYPQITDRHYLELIVLLSGVCCMNFAFERSLDEMKYKILKITMEYKKLLKHQVQAISEGKDEIPEAR